MSLTPFDSGIRSFLDDPLFGMGNLMMSPFSAREGAAGRMRQWKPRADVTEDDRNYIIQAELPGMDKNDVKIDLDEDTGVLTLSGETQQESEQDEANYHIQERFSGSFKRSFALPKNQIDTSNVQAKMDHGVLKITCPKVQRQQQQQRTRSLNIS